MIYALRRNPNLLKDSLGMKLHREAVMKIRGADWESVLFSSEDLSKYSDEELLNPLPGHSKDPDIRKFRKACDEYESHMHDPVAEFLEKNTYGPSRDPEPAA